MSAKRFPPSPPPPAAGISCDGDGRGEDQDDGDEQTEDEAPDHAARRGTALLARRRLSLCKQSVSAGRMEDDRSVHVTVELS